MVALLALSLAQDESEAVDPSMARFVAPPQSRSRTGAESDQDLVNSAEALVCRVFGTVTRDELPDALDGRTSRRSQPSATRRSCSRIRLACHGPYWQRPLVKLPQRCSVAMSLLQRLTVSLPPSRLQ